MIRVEEARALVLQHAPARRVKRMSLEEALGHVVAEDLIAPEPLPPFPRSGMDGYALRSADTQAATKEQPVVLRLAGIIPAGHPMDEPVAPSTTASIMTGGAVPEGADAVIRMEEIRITPQGVVIYRPVAVGENVSPIGEDVAKGQVLLNAGHRIRASEINLLAALGIDRVSVFAPPRVGILCTGDELVGNGVTPGLGQIRNSNGPGLAAMVRAAGCVPVQLGVAHDAADVIAGALGRVQGCDLILTTGGVSVGDFDVVREALAVMGAKELFWRVSMKPGMPICAGLVGDRMVIGLSGNPAAAITNFDLVVRPMLDHLCGRSRIGLRESEAVLDQPVLRKLGVTRYLRAFVYTGPNGELRVNTDMAQRAGVLSSMIHANGYALIPAHTGPIAAGERVRILLQADAELALPVPTSVS